MLSSLISLYISLSLLLATPLFVSVVSPSSSPLSQSPVDIAVLYLFLSFSSICSLPCKIA